MKNVKIITTDYQNEKFWEEKEGVMEKNENAFSIINVFPEAKEQTFHGFGGAITEAAAHIYKSMSEEKQKDIMESCFGETGLRYNMARIHMNSCDFSLGNYCYVEEGDMDLSTFDISHDRKEIIPVIKEAQKTAGKLTFMVSPWSPPAYMKTNNNMNKGGKLKEECYQLWADYFVRYLQEYEKEGIKISYLTVQNETLAVQEWDSCVYTGKEESRFAREFLGPTLRKAGYGDIGIFIWDLNKEGAYDRAKEVLSEEGTSEYIRGTAVHWYTGDHFETLELLRKMYPDKEIFFTEGCVEYSRLADTGEIQKAEMYGHDIIGNLNVGVSASIDWNLLLDHLGGPNHVGNFCAAPIMCEVAKDKLEKRLSYYYIGQFSRYIKEGAVRIMASKYVADLDVTAFLNPDGERVVVVMNRSNEEKEVILKEGNMGMETKIAAHSIVTFCY